MRVNGKEQPWLPVLQAEAERIAQKLPEELRGIFVNSYLCTAQTTVQEVPAPGPDGGVQDTRVPGPDGGVQDTVVPEPGGGVFIVTGDIPAMWLRDSAAQVHHYLPMTARSDAVYAFAAAVLEREFLYIGMDAYANAFNAGPTGRHYRSDDVSGPYFPAGEAAEVEDAADASAGETSSSGETNGAEDAIRTSRSDVTLSEDHAAAISSSELAGAYGKTVARVPVSDAAQTGAWEWERKFETDSLCYPADLAYRLWKASRRTDHLTESVHRGLIRIAEVFRIEQRHEERSDYRFERPGAGALDTLPRDGLGSPVGYTGMTWSGFRASDDACVYGYNIPANMFAVVVMEETAELAQEVFADAALAQEARSLAAGMRHGIETYGIVEHPVYGRIYAYETDGLGHHLLMDDAGIPGLLNIPYLGYCAADDPVYRNTRRFSLSRDNPYYYEGPVLSGLGSPHTLKDGYVWPMGVIAAGLTTLPGDGETRQQDGPAKDQAETGAGRGGSELRDGTSSMLSRSEDPWTYVYAVASADAGTGHVHEAVNCGDASDFTRSWFAWGESLFAELVMKALGEV